MKEILQSKIIRLFVICVALLLVVTYIATPSILGRESYTKRELERKISDFAEVVYFFDMFDEIRPLYGEDEGILFAAELENKGVRIIEANALSPSIISEIEGFDGVGATEGNLLEVKNKSGSAVVDYTKIMDGENLTGEIYKEVILAAYGKYYAGLNQEGVYEIKNAEGKTLQTHKGEIKFLSDGKHILLTFVENDKYGESYEILANLETGKEVRIDDSKTIIYDAFGDKVIVGKEVSKRMFLEQYCYIADENLNPIMGDVIFNNLSFSDDGRYIYGDMYLDVKFGDDESAIRNAEKVQYIVMDSEYNVIHQSEEQQKNHFGYNELYNDINYREVHNGWLTYYEHSDKGDIPCYLNLDSKKEDRTAIRTKKEGMFCALDTEDGISLVSVVKDSKLLGINYHNSMDSKDFHKSDAGWMDDYKWSFVDENFEQICDYIFSGAYPSEDGYAAVKVGDMWGVVRFYDASTSK